MHTYNPDNSYDQRIDDLARNMGTTNHRECKIKKIKPGAGSQI